MTPGRPPSPHTLAQRLQTWREQSWLGPPGPPALGWWPRWGRQGLWAAASLVVVVVVVFVVVVKPLVEEEAVVAVGGAESVM